MREMRRNERREWRRRCSSGEMRGWKRGWREGEMDKGGEWRRKDARKWRGKR